MPNIASAVTATRATAWRASICAAGSSATATTDPQLRTVISNGFPNTGMPAFKLDAAELTGVIAYIRNMNTFDASSMKAGNAANGKTVFEGKGACMSCHRVNNTGSRKAPDCRTSAYCGAPGRSSDRCAIRRAR